MRIWNTVFTGLIHEKSKIESDLERAINNDDNADNKTIIIGELLNMYVLVEAKIVKWGDLKTAYLQTAYLQAQTPQQNEENGDTDSTTG